MVADCGLDVIGYIYFYRELLVDRRFAIGAPNLMLGCPKCFALVCHHKAITVQRLIRTTLGRPTFAR